MSTIVHPLHPLVQTFAFSVLCVFFFFNLFKLFQTCLTHTDALWTEQSCVIASCKLPMKVLYSDSLHAYEADCEHFFINAWLLPEFSS